MNKKVLLTALLLMSAATARADTWACEVLLCMANPAGPMAAGACVPPIKKLWKELARGHAFPTCSLGAGSNQTYVKHEQASPRNCLPAYQYWGGPDNNVLMCDLGGVVTAVVDGKMTSRIWWRSETETVTEYSNGNYLQDGSNGIDRQ